MNYTELIINGESYKLRLNTRNCIALEKALGYNPVQVFMEIDEGKLPKLTDMIIMLQVMLQQLQHGITIEKTYDLFDTYVAEGHNMFDLVPIFIEVFQNSGFISAENVEEIEAQEKN